MSITRFLSAIATVALSAGVTSAATVTAQSNTTSIVGSQENRDVWLSLGTAGHGENFNLDPSGTMTFFSDGTSTLEGKVVSEADDNAWFDLSFNYVENGTSHRSLESGTLTGGGVLSGLELSVTATLLPATSAQQTGIGTANRNNGGQNSGSGVASWFNINVDSVANCLICLKRPGAIRALQNGQGSVNFQLTPVPIPATGVLLIGAIGALGFLRRRKSKTA